jgi:hypothetical protein
VDHSRDAFAAPRMSPLDAVDGSSKQMTFEDGVGNIIDLGEMLLETLEIALAVVVFVRV